MSYDALEPLIPTDGLFRLYHEYTSGNELCPRFRFFSFAAALGSLIRRKVYFQRSSYNMFPTLYPNLWIILVAPQGRGHKSASLSIAKKLIQRLPEQHHPRMMASKLTPEALVKSLAAQAISAEILKNIDPMMISIVKKPAQALLYSSELGVLLGKEKYNQGMIALLTDLYDTPNEWQSDTVMRGDQRLYDVCLSIMGASTPDWMQTMLPPDAFKGGFMSRLLLIGYPETWHCRIADPKPPDESLGDLLLSRLEALATFTGEIKWNKGAKDYFHDWYSTIGDPEPGPRAAYLERKQDQMLRLAILLEVAKAPSLVLTRDSIETSLNLLHCIESDTLRMIDYISVEPRMRVAQRVLEIVEARNIINEQDLMMESWRYLSNPREYDDVFSLLTRSGQIAKVYKDGESYIQFIRRGNFHANFQTHER